MERVLINQLKEISEELNEKQITSELSHLEAEVLESIEFLFNKYEISLDDL